MAYAQTPRAYAQKVAKYAPGDPRRKVAAARALLALRAVEASQYGDLATARHALHGLEKLASFGDIDTAAISASITRDITTANGRLTADARALATGQRVTTIVSAITGIVSPIMTLITNAIGDPGLTRAWNWVNVILRGDVAPTFGPDDLRAIAGACQVWNGGVKTGVQAVAASIGVAVNVLVMTNAVPAGDAATAMQVVNNLVGWVVTALDAICNNATLRAAFPAAPPDCAGPGVRPAGGIVDGCCPSTVFDPADGLCKQASAPPAPAAAARARWQRAWLARRQVEVFLTDLAGVTPANRATAEANDASSAAELCAAERDLLVYEPTIRAFGGTRTAGTADALPPTEAQLATARTNPNVLTLAAIYYSAPTTVPRCYIIRPPAGGCPSGCAAPGGSGSGSGGIVAFALPAAALVWYMMRG